MGAIIARLMPDNAILSDDSLTAGRGTAEVPALWAPCMTGWC